MKKLASFFLILAAVISTTSFAQGDKSQRPSPPATFTTLMNGASITINYSQPAVKGRTIGKDIAPYGKAWRTGANEPTTFEVNKDVTIEGKPLKAGKYALFTIPNENEWTLIFNSVVPQWGIKRTGDADFDPANDALRVNVKPMKAPSFTERMTFAEERGKVALMWGDTEVAFSVK